MMDKALAMLADDMDSMEGDSAMSHSMDDCPDPLGCTMHDSETGANLTPDGGAPAVTIAIHKPGMPSLDGMKEGDGPSLDDKGEEGESLSPEDAEILKKLLK